MKLSTLLLLPALIATMACNNGKKITNSPGTPVEWTKIAENTYSGSETEAYQLIQDEKAWSDFWEQLTSNQYPAPRLPEVNFAEKTIIACVMGMRPNGGFSISIKKLELQANKLLLQVEHKGPGAGCFMTDALTQPYFLATIPRTSAELVTTKVVKLEDCE